MADLIEAEANRMTVYGYTRNSRSSDLQERGCVKIFDEGDVPSRKMPGPAFDRLMDAVEHGDTVLVPSYDRLTRDVRRLEVIVGSLLAVGVDVQTL